MRNCDRKAVRASTRALAERVGHDPDSHAHEIAQEMAVDAVEVYCPHRTLPVVIAGTVYFAGLLAGEHRSQNAIAQVSPVSERSVVNAFEELRERADVLRYTEPTEDVVAVADDLPEWIADAD